MEKLWPHSVTSNHLYSFVWATSCILFLLYFKTSFSDMAETELRVTQALEKPFTIAIFSYTDSWCLVPFGSNISWDPQHKSVFVLTLVATVLFTDRERGSKSGIHSKKILIRSWPPTNIIPVTATLDRVNTALAMCLCQLRMKPATKKSSALIVSAEALAAAARNKKKQTGFQTVQDGKKISIHEVHMYMIG